MRQIIIFIFLLLAPGVAQAAYGDCAFGDCGTGSSSGGSVSDDAYGSGWDGSTTTAPSQNALYDKIETLGGLSGWTDGGTNVFLTSTSDNVGIGTTAATAQLLVENVGTQASFRVNDAASDTTPMVVGSNGNVGISTHTPAALLSVGSASNFRVDTSGNISTIGGVAVTMSGTQMLMNNSGADYSILNNNTTASTALLLAGGAGVGSTLKLRSTTGVGSTDSIRFQVGNNGATEAGRIITDGNWGIGTTKPNAILNIVGANARIGAAGTVDVASGAGDLYIQSDLEVDGTAKLNDIASGATVNGQLICTADGTNCPAAAGNGWTDGGTNIYTSVTTDTVGLGTTTPNATIEIVKQSTSTLFMASSVASGDGDYLIIKSSGNVGIGTLLPGALLEAQGQIRATSFGVIGSSGQTDFSNANGIAFDGNSALMATPDLIVASTSNVGVGTSVPTTKLHVVGAGTFSTTVSVADDAYAAGWNGSTAVPTKNAVYDKIETLGAASGWTDGGSSVYVTTTSDNVGIGTNSPSASLHLNVNDVDGQPRVKITNATTGSGGSDGFEFGLNDDESVVIRNEEDTDITIYTNGIDWFSFKNNGRFGIGTASPNALIEVNGDTGAGQITLDGDTGGCLMLKDTDNSGCTECDANNGTLSCSTDADCICD